MFDKDKYDNTSVEELMIIPNKCVILSDNMEEVMAKFNESGLWNLPVVDDDNKYIGFISRSNIFNFYREKLVEFSAE
jgi:CIC family chloride channel protein